MFSCWTSVYLEHLERWLSMFMFTSVKKNFAKTEKSTLKFGSKFVTKENSLMKVNRKSLNRKSSKLNWIRGKSLTASSQWIIPVCHSMFDYVYVYFCLFINFNVKTLHNNTTHNNDLEYLCIAPCQTHIWLSD